MVFLVSLAHAIYTRYAREALTRALFDHGFASSLSRRDVLRSAPEYVVEMEPTDSAEVFTLTEPPAVGTLPATIREKAREWSLDQPFVATLRDVQLVGPNALPIAPDGAYVLEAADGSAPRVTDELVRTIGAGRLPVCRSADRTVETAVPLTGPWSREFFHWFVDYLPRLRQIERLYGTLDAGPPLLIPSNPPDWLRTSLDLLGVDEGHRLEWSGGRVTIKRLVVPSLPRHTESTAPDAGYVQSPRAVGWVADRLRDAVDHDDRPDIGRRLYISRAGQPDRDVVNEAELRSTLAAYDFEVVHPEEWSLPQQVAAFADTEAVCGPHGAGLVNFVYADDSATLLELFGARTNPCFYAIAAGLERRYAVHAATAEGDHLRVDPDRLSDLLGLLDDQPRSNTDSK